MAARSPSPTGKTPPCMAFQSLPSDIELVHSYLRTWVETGVKTGAFIHDADVYAADPADLTRRFAPAVASDGERAWFFYTPLRHKSVRGKRKTRTVATGGGCWHNEAKSKPVIMVVDGTSRQIGHRQSFSFVKKDTGVRVRTGWLMVELRLLKDGGAAQAGKKKPDEEESALGHRVLCKVYRSPRNPEPSSGGGATPTAAAEADDDDDESSDATLDDNYNDDVGDDDSSAASLEAAAAPGPKNEVESSDATVAAAPSRHSKANDDEISGKAPGRKEKAEVDEDSIETSAAAPPRKRKALDDETSGAAAGAPASALKKKADGSSSAPGAPVCSAEMQCPQCGTHLVITLKKAESKPDTENAKEESTSPGAPQRGETTPRASSQKSVRFHQFL